MNESQALSYQAAVTMYNREHDRWYQWALFFFGAVGGIFYVAGHIDAPKFVAPSLSCLVSLMWVGVASNIRATTDCWRETLVELESGHEVEQGAFQVFKQKLDIYDFSGDFGKTLRIWRRQTYTSVTRLLVLSGMLSCFAFLVITIISLVAWR